MNKNVIKSKYSIDQYQCTFQAAIIGVYSIRKSTYLINQVTNRTQVQPNIF